MSFLLSPTAGSRESTGINAVPSKRRVETPVGNPRTSKDALHAEVSRFHTAAPLSDAAVAFSARKTDSTAMSDALYGGSSAPAESPTRRGTGLGARPEGGVAHALAGGFAYHEQQQLASAMGGLSVQESGAGGRHLTHNVSSGVGSLLYQPVQEPPPPRRSPSSVRMTADANAHAVGPIVAAVAAEVATAASVYAARGRSAVIGDMLVDPAGANPLPVGGRDSLATLTLPPAGGSTRSSLRSPTHPRAPLFTSSVVLAHGEGEQQGSSWLTATRATHSETSLSTPRESQWGSPQPRPQGRGEVTTPHVDINRRNIWID